MILSLLSRLGSVARLGSINVTGSTNAHVMISEEINL